jgi:hypothetical protein
MMHDELRAAHARAPRTVWRQWLATNRSVSQWLTGHQSQRPPAPACEFYVNLSRQKSNDLSTYAVSPIILLCTMKAGNLPYAPPPVASLSFAGQKTNTSRRNHGVLTRNISFLNLRGWGKTRRISGLSAKCATVVWSRLLTAPSHPKLAAEFEMRLNGCEGIQHLHRSFPGPLRVRKG